METVAGFIGHHNKEDTLSELGLTASYSASWAKQGAGGEEDPRSCRYKEKTPESGHAESSSLEDLKICNILHTWRPI